jgi:hypothetical protein
MYGPFQPSDPCSADFNSGGLTGDFPLNNEATMPV